MYQAREGFVESGGRIHPTCQAGLAAETVSGAIRILPVLNRGRSHRDG